MNKVVYLKSGRERSVHHRHPWIFRGAVSRLEGQPENGEVVEVRDSKGEFLAYSAYSHYSSICLRNLTYTKEIYPDRDWIYDRVVKACQLRKAADIDRETNSWRLLFGEADGLPGVIADRYGDAVILQLSTTWADQNKADIAAAITEVYNVSGIYERSDSDIRRLEGLGIASGPITGKVPADQMILTEYDRKYQVNLFSGQKSGFYLDQRVNREKIKKYVSQRRVLNCFSYTGGFTVPALQAGADEVTSVDISEDAVLAVQENVRLNHLDISRSHVVCGDVFSYLRLMRDKGEKYDLIILDPPKFAPTVAQLEKASRGYKDINLLAIKLLNPGGILVTFSCSGGVDAALFQKIVSDAALDAQANVSILETLRQAADHPVSLCFPESSYLKGLICYKIE